MKTQPFKTLGILIALLSLPALSVTAATAASYPNKPVRMMVTMAPGGANDIIGRLVATKLTERLGKQVVVENNAGGGGIIGTEMVAKANPDGYTLLLVAGSHSTQPALQQLPFDPIKSFTPIAKLGSAQYTLVVNPGVPAKSVKELIALAKQKPGELVFVTAGHGATAHLATELLKIMADIDVKVVHFKGGGPAMIDLIGGHSHANFGSLPNNLSHIKSGKVRVLGTCGVKRSTILPDVPTIAEAGVPGFELSQWWAILAPAGTPAPIVDRLNNELKTILTSDDEVKKLFMNQGAETDYLSPAEFGPFLAADIAKWSRVVKQANLKLEQ
jgi:tripartite-type tricarboxylate transporter receptor subunit TctC